MDLAGVASVLDALVVDELDKAGVVDGLRTTTRLRRLLDAFDMRLNRRLVELAAEDPAISPDHANAEATQRSLRKGADSIRRATRASSVPILEAAVADGSLSVEHVDVFMVAVGDPRLLDARVDVRVASRRVLGRRRPNRPRQSDPALPTPPRPPPHRRLGTHPRTRPITRHPQTRGDRHVHRTTRTPVGLTARTRG